MANEQKVEKHEKLPPAIDAGKGKLVRNPDGTLKSGVLNPYGKSGDPAKLLSKIRTFMEEREPNDPASMSRLDKHLHQIHKLIMLMTTDPKFANAGVKAMEMLWNRAYFKPSRDPAEIEALARIGPSSVQIQVVKLPDLPMPTTKPRPTKPAEFIDADVVDES